MIIDIAKSIYRSIKDYIKKRREKKKKKEEIEKEITKLNN